MTEAIVADARDPKRRPKPNPDMEPKWEPYPEIGARLLALIERRGFESVSAAAASAGINRQQLWDLINGKDPRVSTLEKIVEKLGGTMAEFYDPDVDLSKYGFSRF